MKIPLKQIAEDCQVSITTVSRVINQKGRISQQTRDKILKYIERKETEIYTQSFSKKTIGVIVPNIQNEYYSAMVSIIDTYFSKRNCSILLHITSKDIQQKKAAFDDFVYRQVAGIIYIGGPEKFLDYQTLNNIPLICIEHSPVINGSCQCLIQANHDIGGYLATQELLKNGCCQILFLANSNMLKEETGRYSGYKRALMEANISLDPKLVFQSPSQKFGIMEAKNAIHYLLAKSVSFDGVFATTDWRGYAVIAALKEHNIKIPEQIQVIGYDNISISKYTFPSLTTIHINYEQIAHIACEQLEKVLHHENIENPLITISPYIIKRETTHFK